MVHLLRRRPRKATTAVNNDSCYKEKVRVRAKVLCTSENLENLYQKHQQRQHEQQQSTPRDNEYSPHKPPPRRRPVEDPWSPDKLQEAIDLWKLDKDQILRLQELHHNLKDIDHFKFDPHIVLRFMTSPQGKDAERNFRAMITWRLQNNIDSLLEDYRPPPLLIKYNPTTILKDCDRDGNPIYIERGGATDLVGMLRKYSREELMKYAIWTRELNTQGVWLDDYERRQGQKVKDITVVYDLNGMNTRHLHPQALEFFGAIQTLNAERYPGPIKRIIVLRAPAIFRVGWNLVKHFFPASARDKMVFAGKHNYAQVLDKYIDLNVLPPCIYQHGTGEAAVGLPPLMQGQMVLTEEDIKDGRTSPTSYYLPNKAYNSLETLDSTVSELTDQVSVSESGSCISL